MMELLLPVVKEQFQEEWEKTPSIEKEQWLDIESTENVKLQDIRHWIEKGFLFVYLVKGQLKVNIPTELKYVMQKNNQHSFRRRNRQICCVLSTCKDDKKYIRFYQY